MTAFQKRAQLKSKGGKASKVKKRLCKGLREVYRGCRAGKAKVVFLANNLEDSNAVNDKVLEILEACKGNEIPVLCCFNARKLGKLIGVNLKVSVLAVESMEGCEVQWKAVKKAAGLP